MEAKKKKTTNIKSHYFPNAQEMGWNLILLKE